MIASKTPVKTVAVLKGFFDVEKLEQQLEEKVAFAADGGGFGCRDAVVQHQREIDLLKFKISRRDNYKIAVLSAVIGAIIGSVVMAISSIW